MKQVIVALAVVLTAGCAAITNTGAINLGKSSQEQKTYAPIINSMTANPTNTTTGQPITFDVKATDPNGQAMQYTWSAASGVISASAGQTISWTPPSTAGAYPIQVTITNQDGKTTSGSLNVIVKTDGNVSVSSPTATASN